MDEEPITTNIESPLDELIAKMDEYIRDPKLVTTETLTEFKDLLMEMKDMMGEGESEPESEGEGEHRGGLIIEIGKAKGRYGK